MGIAHSHKVGDEIPASPKYDLVIESVGGRTLGTALAALERGGMCVTLGVSAAAEVTFDTRTFFVSGRTTLYGFCLFVELGNDPAGHGQVDAWYSPAVGFFVKLSANFTLEAYGFEAVAFSMALKSSGPGLAPNSDTTAPIPQYEYPAEMEIVSDVAFPYNWASGPVTARFGLQEGSSPNDPPTKVDAVATDAPAALADYRIKWSYDVGDGPVEVEASSLELAFTAPGNFYVYVEFYSKDPCIEGSTGTSAYAQFYWEKTFPVAMGPGTGTTVEVGTFPVEPNSFHILATWTLTATAGSVVDAGRAAVLNAEGTAVPPVEPTASSAKFTAYSFGTFKLQWVPERATVGDDVTIVLRVNYF